MCSFPSSLVSGHSVAQLEPEDRSDSTTGSIISSISSSSCASCRSSLSRATEGKEMCYTKVHAFALRMHPDNRRFLQRIPLYLVLFYSASKGSSSGVQSVLDIHITDVMHKSMAYFRAQGNSGYDFMRTIIARPK